MRIGKTRAGALRIAAIYALVASLWIAISDRLLVPFVGSAALLYSTAKGLAFVLATATLLYLLVQRDLSVIERARARLGATVARLGEEGRRKDEFISMLSHELRNPLTPILNSVYLLKRNPSLDEAARRSLSTVDRQAAHLAKLVNDLLDLDRIATGRLVLHRSRLDLSALVRATVDDYETVLDGRRLFVHLPASSVEVEADSDRLVQALGNLLSNAAKFTAPGGRVDVSLAEIADSAVIEVSDSGVGVPPALKERIFEPFVQGERTLARRHGGLGLGLALVRGIVELHGGRVGLESEGRGRGARFSITLPRLPRSEASLEGPGATSLGDAPHA